jgi:hypothetical protein
MATLWSNVAKALLLAVANASRHVTNRHALFLRFLSRNIKNIIVDSDSGSHYFSDALGNFLALERQYCINASI